MRGERLIRALGSRVKCPNCGRSYSRFAPGPGARPGRCCWHCGSLERHRALALALAGRRHLLPDRVRVLHLAPEDAVSRLLPATADVVRGDLEPLPGDQVIDVSAMAQFGDGDFDAVICMHVLEHVLDDRAALREIRRVLRPGGWAVVHVPLTVGATVEDPAETDPARRLERFGQVDHVRSYGPDFIERVEQAGLTAEVAGFDDPETIDRYGLRAPLGVESTVFAYPRP
ncbi:MAG: class I SAM-dependent methyltransferase [Solirubrobacteraceae bacterium]